jgi:predicted amidohydrolase
MEMIRQAAGNGAQVIALPEIFYYPYDLNKIKQIVGKEDLYLDLLTGEAKKNNVYLSTGSMAVACGESIFNMSHMIGPEGCVLGEYSKSHLYDANPGGTEIRESAVFTPGNSILVVKTDLGVMGIMICYDIRFPELARLYALAGVEILFVPSVFNAVTGAAHWHTMMKARAIENQIFIAATSQARNSSSPYTAYGHSLVVTPWGDIACEAGENEQIIYYTLEPEIMEKSRNRLPLLSHRRTDLYSINYNGDGKS